MAQSKIFEKAQEYYEQGFWSEKRLRMLVKAKALTKTEFKKITGGDY